MPEDPIQHAHLEQQRIFDALRAHLGPAMSPERLSASIDVLARISEWSVDEAPELGEGWTRARAEAMREAIETANAYLRLLYLHRDDPHLHREAS